MTDEALLLKRAMLAMDAECAARNVLAVRFAGDLHLATIAPGAITFAGFSALTPRQLSVAGRLGAGVLPCPDEGPAPLARSFR